MAIHTETLRQIAEHSIYPESQRLAAELLACREERDAARAELEELRTEWFGIAGGENSFPSDRSGDAIAQQRVSAWTEAQARIFNQKSAELAAVKRQRDEAIEKMRELERWARLHAQNQERWAFDQLGVWRCVATEIRSAIKMLALAAEQPAPAQQPKPIEARPWWVVFGLERWEATKLHALHPTQLERKLGGLVDIAGKRQIHPTEIARALDEARAELQPKPEVQP